MNSLSFLIILCLIYYCIYRWYPQYLNEKYNYYFGGFVIVYLFILYLFTYEKQFMYKMFQNIHDTQKQPLALFNAKGSNSDLYNSFTQNSNSDLKLMLAHNQHSRCAQCQNYILSNDINYYKLKYLIPLQSGGQNDISNLCLVCPNCMF